VPMDRDVARRLRALLLGLFARKGLPAVVVIEQSGDQLRVLLDLEEARVLADALEDSE
jgi:hypothetical protein